MIPNALLSTENLSIGYAQQPIATALNLTLQAGTFTCLIGPNGAGKSTLLRTLAGMQAPQAGQVRLAGLPLAQLSANQRAQQLAVVLTERLAVGALPVRDLVALGRQPYTTWAGNLSAADWDVVAWALEAVGMRELAERDINRLSDGERQKALIARALAQQPSVLLLDEPTAFLDAPRRAEIMGLLRTLTRQLECAVLLSTHDLDLALRLADTLWLLPHGGAFQIGAPEDLALSGALAQAFRSEGVLFDAVTGGFSAAVTPAAGVVDLYGTGLGAIWTAKALERAGYCPQLDGTSAAVRVSVTAEGWLVTPTGGSPVLCSSLAAVLNCLNGVRF